MAWRTEYKSVNHEDYRPHDSYRPEIDGLRAVAILPVIAFHLGATWLPGGFVGVDVFFVISGYLITAIILKDCSQHEFTIRSFWLRRIRRILPAMLLMLMVSLGAGYLILSGADRSSLGWQGISAIFLSANTMMWHLAGDYWAPDVAKLPLLHIWSLSIEEQFYLIYPLFIMACLRWFPKRLPVCLAAVLTLSLATCIKVTAGSSSSAFYSLSTRAWELASGCLLAASTFHHSPAPNAAPNGRRRDLPSLRRPLAMVGLGLVVASFFAVTAEGFPGYRACLPVLGSVLVIQFTGDNGCLVTAFLSSPVMRFVGKISYSLYLWHWPVIVLGRAARARWENIPVWFCVVLIPVLAVAAYYAVEQPGRRLRNPLRVLVPGAGAVLGLSACLALTKTHFDLSRFVPTVWMGEAYTVTPLDTAGRSQWQSVFDGVTVPPPDSKYTNAFARGGIVKQYGGKSVDVLVFGDSHALMWAPVIDEICQECRFTVAFDAVGGVDPVPSIPPQRKAVGGFSPDQWLAFESNRLEWVQDRHPRLIIIAARWTTYALSNKLPAFLAEVANNNRVRNTNAQTAVLLVEDPPEWTLVGMNAPQFCSTTSATAVKPAVLAAQSAVASTLRSVSQKFAEVHTLETADLYLTKEGMVKIRDGNALLYFDGNHLSLAGARLAKDRIQSAITNLASRSPPR